MWSLGCIVAEIITGMIAVDGNFCDMYDNILKFLWLQHF